ncbi:hypothetical protein KAH94_03690 [bacterium]|nr:hypothetical protein [bacterium]
MNIKTALTGLIIFGIFDGCTMQASQKKFSECKKKLEKDYKENLVNTNHCDRYLEIFSTKNLKGFRYIKKAEFIVVGLRNAVELTPNQGEDSYPFILKYDEDGKFIRKKGYKNPKVDKFNILNISMLIYLEKIVGMPQEGEVSLYNLFLRTSIKKNKKPEIYLEEFSVEEK